MIRASSIGGPALGRLMLVASCLALACRSSTDPVALEDPTAPAAGGDRQASVTPPANDLTLLVPIDGALIRQNDPDIGCQPHPHRGYGFRIRFDWTDGSGDVGGYHLYVHKRGAEFPMLNTYVDRSEFTGTWCNSFVIDRNLPDWDWRVRPLFADGTEGEWTPVATFGFAACRLDDGRACNAPPETP